MANDLVIKINGDIQGFKTALGEAQKQTEGLSDGLKDTAKVSGVAFAALTAEIALSVAAFAESEQATNELTNAMINQGVYSKQLLGQYQSMASEIQNLTGVSDEAVLSAQTTIQAYIGQNQVTKELTLAIADFAQAQGVDLASAAQILGKGIQGNTEALKRYGLSVDDAGNKTDNMSRIIDAVNGKFGGSAQAAAEGYSGSLKRLTETFGNLQEELGARFAPLITSITNGITGFFQSIQSSKGLTDLISGVIAGGAAFTGLIAAVSTAGVVFLSLKALLLAAGVAFSTIAAPVAIVVAAIAAISVGIGYLVVNWSTAWPKMQAAFSAFTQNITDLASGVGKVLMGALTLDPAQIREGLEETKKALRDGLTDYETISTEKLAAIEANEAEAEQRKTDRSAQAAEARKAEAQAEKDRAEAQEVDLAELDKAAKDQQLINRAVAYEALLSQNEEFQALDEEQQAAFRQANDAANIERTDTEATSRLLLAQQKLQEQQRLNQQMLLEEQKYGVAYATINKAMHSEVYQGTKQAVGEMVQFTQSSNSTLKGIGKAAAVANIVIRTAESAMNIYAGFSSIPIIGPVLGVAGAAAAVAFGAEQIGQVTKAAQGGLLTGGISGVDSIPVLAQRNELISPAQTFEEVIGSVRAGREAQKLAAETGFGASGGGQATVMIGFDGKEASQVLTARQIEDRALGISQEATTA